MTDLSRRRAARDARRSATASVQGTLALDLGPRLDPPEVPLPRSPASARTRLDEDRFTQRRFEQWARAYLQSVVEAASGHRPATQVLRLTARDVYEDLVRRIQLVSRAAGNVPGSTPRPRIRPQVRSVHATLVASRTYEVAAVVRYGERHRALAARFAYRNKRMQCTALEWA